MLNEVFLDLVKADFIKAIGKHAKKAGVGNEEIQIQIKLDAEEGLTYAIYQQWKPSNPKCSFKEVMCFQLDVFNKEGMLSPHIYEMLLKQVTAYEADPTNFSAFLFERHKTIACALYVGNTPVRTCLLAELFV